MRYLAKILLFWSVFQTIFNFGYCLTPSGCSYDDTDSVGVYTCDYTSVSWALSYSGFSPAPQRLVVNKINGALIAAGGSFSGFSSYDPTTLDSNYAASLELICSTSATTSLTLPVGTFTGMAYVQRMTISNCYINALSSSVFADFTQLDSLVITGGQIGTFDSGTFTNLDIQPISGIPNPSGRLEISNVIMPATTLTASVLAPLTNIVEIKLDNIGLTSIQNSDLSSNTLLEKLIVSNNALTTLASGFFTGFNALITVDLSGNSWDCSCTNLWFLTYADDNGIEFEGGSVCGTPTAYTNKKTEIYYTESCTTTDPCNGAPGIATGSSCIMAWDLAAYCILLVAAVVSSVALGLVCQTRKQLLTAKNKLANKKNASWSKVQEAMKKRGGAGQKPPAGNGKPNNGKGWV